VAGVDQTYIDGVGEKMKLKTPLGRPRSRWENTIKIDPNYISWKRVDWVYLA